MFLDRVTLQLSAGKGGNGVVAWRREKYVPKGGPAGGDGGDGGSIIFQADPEMHSLESYRNRRIIKAPNGMPGEGGNRKGRNGKDLLLKIPLGTLIKETVSNQLLFDCTAQAESWKICIGGKGGKGNSHFKTATHQAPYISTDGIPGQACTVELELKLIADIGLVGMPNSGKSTLISRIAHIDVKIAPYPFTTLRPNLGAIFVEPWSRILIADIPGIIEKAHQNKGLGFSFLRHIERTSALLFVIDLCSYRDQDPFEEFQILRKELAAYHSSLLEKPFLVVLNKMDCEGATEHAIAFRNLYPYPLSTLFEISALTGQGLERLKEAMVKLVPPRLKTDDQPKIVSRMGGIMESVMEELHSIIETRR